MRRLLARWLAALAISTLCLSVWLLVPRRAAAEAAGAPLRAVLVDASASVTRTRPGWTAWARRELAAEARAAQAAGERLVVVCFAGDVRVRFGPGAPARLLEELEGRAGAPPFDPAAGAGDDAATRLADALASVLAVAPDDAPGGRLVLLGEPSWSGRAPAPELARLAARALALELREPPPATLPELALEALELPAEVEVGAPAAAVVRLRWRPAAGALAPSAALAVRTEEAGVVRERSHPLVLPPGPARWSETVPLGLAGLGRTEVRVRAALASGPDPVPENDELGGSFRGEGTLHIGVVCEDEARAAASAVYLPSGISALPGVELALLAPEELAREGAGLDCLVVHDVSLERLPAAFAEAFVAEGGGLLACAGWRALADWLPGRAPTRLEALLPLAPRASDAPPRDVVLLVDGSGSMAGEPFEMVRAAAVALVAAALPSDRLSLRFFTTGLEQELLLRERVADADPSTADAADELARRLLRARVPGGQTMILRSLGQLAELRREQEAEALVLLLSDGRERDTLPRPLEAARRLRAELAAVRTRLVVIGVGEDQDRAFLAALAPEGEEVAHAASLDELESVFRRSVGGARVREGRIVPRPAPHGEDSLAAAALGAAGDEPLPPLARLARAELRPGASLAWEDEEGEPVLGLWRVGAGRTAFFASLPGGSWAPAWGGRLGPGEPRPLGPLLRWLARGARGRRGAPRLTVEPAGAEEEGVRLVLRGLPEGAAELVELRLADASGEELTLSLAPRLEPSGVRAAGLREGRGPAALAAPERGWTALLDLGDGQERVVALERGLPEELSSAGPGTGPEAELALARWTTGEALVPPRRPAPRQSPLGPAVLGAGLVLLFLWAVLANAGQGSAASGR